MRRTLLALATIALTVAAGALADPAAGATTADLALTQTAAPQPAGVLDLRIVITNQGPSTAKTVRLNEFLAGSGITSVSHTSNRSKASCRAITPLSGFTLGRQCTIGQLAAGAVWDVTYIVKAPTGTPIQSRAGVHSAVTDPDNANNVATVSSWTGPVTDIAVQFISESAPDSAGFVTAGISVQNLGPNMSNNIVLSASEGEWLGTTSGLIAPICPDTAVAAALDACAVGAFPAGEGTTADLKFFGIPTHAPLTVSVYSTSGTFDPVSSDDTTSVPQPA
jgi:hypothetical protein